MQSFQTALSIVYPSQCLGCGTAVAGEVGLCGPCWRETPFVGGAICEGCGVPLPGSMPERNIWCDSCISTPQPWARARAALLYEGMARKLVLALKHGDRHEIAMPAGVWMARAGVDLWEPHTLLLPVPLHWTRLFRRRANQAALLTKSVARQTGLDWGPDVLERPNRTPNLDGKSREDRFNILRGAISVAPRRRHRIAGRPVVLIDDVMTSGATFAAATQVCLAAGASSVSVLALARVVKGD